MGVWKRSGGRLVRANSTVVASRAERRRRRGTRAVHGAAAAAAAPAAEPLPPAPPAADCGAEPALGSSAAAAAATPASHDDAQSASPAAAVSTPASFNDEQSAISAAAVSTPASLNDEQSASSAAAVSTPASLNDEQSASSAAAASTPASSAFGAFNEWGLVCVLSYLADADIRPLRLLRAVSKRFATCAAAPQLYTHYRPDEVFGGGPDFRKLEMLMCFAAAGAHIESLHMVLGREDLGVLAALLAKCDTTRLAEVRLLEMYGAKLLIAWDSCCDQRDASSFMTEGTHEGARGKFSRTTGSSASQEETAFGEVASLLGRCRSLCRMTVRGFGRPELLVSKCSSLTTLRLLGDGTKCDDEDRRADLDHMLSSMPMLRRIEFRGGVSKPGQHVRLESSSLEVVDLSGARKEFILSALLCPGLRHLAIRPGGYGTGFRHAFIEMPGGDFSELDRMEWEPLAGKKFIATCGFELDGDGELTVEMDVHPEAQLWWGEQWSLEGGFFETGGRV